MSTSACNNYDFRISVLPKIDGEEGEEILPEKVKEYLGEFCDKWVFQKEKGAETGYLHYQGRMHLKVKRLKHPCLDTWKSMGMAPEWLAPTTKENQGNNFYVTKPDTRVEGPWDNESDEREKNAPWDLEGLQLWPWQKQVLESRLIKEDRIINVVVDFKGKIGKTKCLKYGLYHQLCGWIPATFKCAQDVMRCVWGQPKRGLYIIDMPRAMNNNSPDIYAGIEGVKNGIVYDDRYEWKFKIFGCPQIWVFTNSHAPKKFLSEDRWVYWRINSEHELEKVEAQEKRPAPEMSEDEVRDLLNTEF